MVDMRSATRSGPFVEDDLAALPDDGHAYQVVDGVLYGYGFSRAERDDRPEDGCRHELLDGTLIVSPAPRWPHQRVVANLLVTLHAACPPQLETFVAPLDVTMGPRTVLEPDVLVVARSALGEKVLEDLLMLAVEVLSPSTRRLDLTRKHAAYEAAGVASYWVIDPDEPRLTAWELRDGTYVEVASVVGVDILLTEQPFPVQFSPAGLVA